MQKAKDVMTASPYCCTQENTIYDAVSIMKKQNCGFVPVVDQGGSCVGVVTDRDICLQVVLDRKDPHQTRLREVMTRNPLTCSPEESMDDVLVKMEKRMIRRIPVVDQENQCVGIISEADLATKKRVNRV